MSNATYQPNIDLTKLVDRAAERFTALYGRPPRWIAAAPGRVNIIGEHTDYNGGFVLPMAIERYTVVAADTAESGQEDRVRLYSSGIEEKTQISLAEPIRPGEPRWANYVRGIMAGFIEREIPVPGFNAVIESTVPLGGGLSSSAALEVATATLLEAMTGCTLNPVEKTLLCQRAEHVFAGTPSGIMDQFTSIHGRADHLLLLDCRTLATRHVPFVDPEVTVLIINTNVKHELSHGPDGVSAYAQRRQQCEAAARSLGVSELRDATMAQLEAASLDDLTHRRARHVITEIARTLEAADAIAERRWSRAGELMYASHASLRNDFEVSIPELDLLVELAGEIGESGGVYGSRMTGGGFGGCTVSLVRTEAVHDIARRIATDYEKKTGIPPTTYLTRPANGACVIRSPFPSGREPE